MVALYILGGFLLLLFLLLLLRVGVEVRLGEPLTVTLRFGPGRLRLLPGKEKKKKEPKAERPKKEKKAKAARQPKSGKTKPKIGFPEVRQGAELLLPALKKALGRTRRSIRVKPLNVHVVFGGDDPAEVAEQYGWATAAMWSLMPQAERLLTIPEPHIRLDTDFEASATRTEGEIGLSIRIGSTLRIGLALLPAALRWYRKLPRVPAEEKKTETAPPDAAAAASEGTDAADKPEPAEEAHPDKKGE
ncbi:MAG: DUF2953 domain-containing protein [Oscillospiraceae bacterium]